MTAITVYTGWPVGEFVSEVSGVNPILSTGTIIDSSQLAAVQAAATAAGIVVEEGAPPDYGVVPQTAVTASDISAALAAAVLNGPLVLDAPSVTATTALVVNDTNGGRTGGGQLLAVFDHNGAIIFSIGPVGGPTVFGDHMRAGQGVFGPFVSLDGTTNPPSIEFPDGSHHYSGSGVPTTALSAVTAAVGDKYWRIDTPSTADQRLYICTAAGTPGTWVGIL